jgi:ankyrin repeat protein
MWTPGTKRRTPLCLASERGKPAVARVLLRHGADTKARKEGDQTPLHQANSKEVARILLEHKADVDALDIKNQTPLHRLTKCGHVGAAQVLLEHGVDPNARDVNNATPLHLTSNPKHEYMVGRCFQVVKSLLQYGSDIHARDDEGQTPFMRATAKEYREIMQLLLEHGAEDHRV